MAYTPEYALSDAVNIGSDVALTGFVALKPFLPSLIQLAILGVVMGILLGLFGVVFGFIKLPARLMK